MTGSPEASNAAAGDEARVPEPTQPEQQVQGRASRARLSGEQAAALAQHVLLQQAAARLLLEKQQQGAQADPAHLRRCATSRHNAAMSLRQVEDALERYRWHNELLRDVFRPLLPRRPGGGADTEAGAGEETQQGPEQRVEATLGQQLLAAAVERLGGPPALAAAAAEHAESAAAPEAHPAWQPPMPAAAVARFIAEQQRRRLAEWLSGGRGLAEQPTKVALPSA